MDVFEGITALADYGVRTGLIEEADRTWAVNALLAALELDDMVKCTLKIYKATAPEDLTTGLPTGGGG